MAINPRLEQTGRPEMMPDERILLERKDISYDVAINLQGRYLGKGKLYLTNKRLVLVNCDGNLEEACRSFEIPLVLIYKEKF